MLKVSVVQNRFTLLQYYRRKKRCRQSFEYQSWSDGLGKSWTLGTAPHKPSRRCFVQAVLLPNGYTGFLCYSVIIPSSQSISSQCIYFFGLHTYVFLPHVSVLVVSLWHFLGCNVKVCKWTVLGFSHSASSLLRLALLSRRSPTESCIVLLQDSATLKSKPEPGSDSSSSRIFSLQ